MNPASLLLSSSVASHSCVASILFGILQHPDIYREFDNSTQHFENSQLLANHFNQSNQNNQ